MIFEIADLGSAMGMGRYQWFIFFLCGFGYFLDLCWAQAGGLVGPALQAELGVKGELTTISSIIARD